MELSVELRHKLEAVESLLGGKSVTVAYSGGVDSSVLLEIAHRNSSKALGVLAVSTLMSEDEVSHAKTLARQRGWSVEEVRIDPLQDPNFYSNPPNRCYYCKRVIMEGIVALAEESGADMVVEGTNQSEVTEHRPGILALREKGVRSPFHELGVTKDEVRTLARFFGLPNANAPSQTCLATRIPYGLEITTERLVRVFQAENYLRRTFGLIIFRVRDHDDLARVEVGEEELQGILEVTALKKMDAGLKDLGFAYVSLDCAGYRSGSLTQGL